MQSTKFYLTLTFLISLLFLFECKRSQHSKYIIVSQTVLNVKYGDTVATGWIDDTFNIYNPKEDTLIEKKALQDRGYLINNNKNNKNNKNSYLIPIMNGEGFILDFSKSNTLH